MSISADQNLISAIVQMYRKIHGQDPTAETIEFWLKKIKSKEIDLAAIETEMRSGEIADYETADAIEYEESTMQDPAYEVAMVGEAAAGMGSAGAASASVGGIAAAVGGIAAAAGGGGGGGGANMPQPTLSVASTPSQSKEPSVNTSGSGSGSKSGSSGSSGSTTTVGDSGTTSSSGNAQSSGSIRELKKDFIASIDLRFDQPNDRVSRDLDSSGPLVNSFESVRRHVDMAKSHGFTAIELDLNVPINRETGELQMMTPPGTWNPDKSLPDDLWKIVSYAESQGLGTSLRLNIVDAMTDNILIRNQVGAGFDVNEFFQSVKSYQMMIAKDAQYYGVDQLVIGSMNFGFDTAYRAQWQDVINGIKSVYSGELAYESAYQLDDVVVWELVDNVALTFQPNLGEPPDSAVEIVPLYLQTKDQSGWGAFNPYETVIDTIQRFGDKDVMLYNIAKSPVQPGIGETVNVHDVVYKDNDVLDLSALNFDLLATRYAGFLEFFNNYLDNDIDAVQFWQFAPWADADWIRNPMDANGEAMNAYARGGYFLNYQPEALDILEDYLKHGWGTNYLDFPDSNDVLPDRTPSAWLNNILTMPNNEGFLA